MVRKTCELKIVNSCIPIEIYDDYFPFAKNRKEYVLLCDVFLLHYNDFQVFHIQLQKRCCIKVSELLAFL